MAMQPQSSFDALSRVLERLGTGNRTVRRAEAAAGGDAEGPLRATVEIEVPLSDAADVEARAAGQSSTPLGSDDLELTVRVPLFPTSPADETAGLPDGTAVSTTTTDVDLDGGVALVTLTVTIDAASGSSPAASETDADARVETASTTDPTTESAIRSDSGPESATSTDSGPESTTSTDSATDSAIPSAPTTDSADDFTRGGTSTASSESGNDADSQPTVVEPESEALAAARDESVPPYEDTAYLQRLYDACATFKEMSRRIEMDVSSETVRRYMIEAGVHTPTSYATDSPDSDGAGSSAESASVNGSGGSEAAKGSGQSLTATTDDSAADAPQQEVSSDPLPDEQLVTDGIGFPDRLTLQDVVDAVLGARTVHEVSREFGVPTDRTRELLRQLNVLDLVLGRVAAETEREISAEDVAARIRESAPDGT